MAATSARPATGFFNTRRGRIVRENLTAYLFLAPAGLIIFVFGLFPVLFAFFVSLHRWRRFPDEYRGLDQYVEALGSFAYVVFFWLSVGALIFTGLTLARVWRESREDRRSLLYIIPGAASTFGILAFTDYFFRLLPTVLLIPQRLLRERRSDDIFVNEFFASFRDPFVYAAADTMLLGVALGIGVGLIFLWLAPTTRGGHHWLLNTLALTIGAFGYLLLRLTVSEIDLAVAEAQAVGQSLPVWTYIILISAGAALLAGAYVSFRAAVRSESDRQFVLFGLGAILLVIGGYALITQLPQALRDVDRDVIQGFNVTVMYSLGTIPFQLAIGLGLAVLLFQNIRAKSAFRIIYFLPYITPFVATSLIFTLIFSHRAGPANQLMAALGLPSQNWLLEPRGIFEVILGTSLPAWASGPGQALVVMIIYNTWTYAGYSTVIFLAGLGNIPKEMYEAARIDGANAWQTFRRITLPLLSPTTFFLVLIATIGTFQAFTQIWLMRKPGALAAVDTINIYIFEEINAENPDYAYGSALAFVLFGVILMLTLVQNRMARRRVFYG
jgi:multiple sugar transport system permease protein